jgi:hypothetical protein
VEKFHQQFVYKTKGRLFSPQDCWAHHSSAQIILIYKHAAMRSSACRTVAIKGLLKCWSWSLAVMFNACLLLLISQRWPLEVLGSHIQSSPFNALHGFAVIPGVQCRRCTHAHSLTHTHTHVDGRRQCAKWP